MTKTQERRFNMVQAVVRFCDQHPDILSANKPFQKAYLQLKRQAVAIQEAADGQDTNPSGSQRAKSLTRARLCLEASVTCGLLCAWAADAEKTELEERNDWTESTLGRLPDVRLERTCRTILSDARATLATDPDCGLTAESLRQLEALIGSFAEQKEAPRNKTAERSTHTQNMATLMKGLTELFRDKLDKAALGFKKSHPEFYVQYKENRKIMDVAVRTGEGDGANNG